MTISWQSISFLSSSSTSFYCLFAIGSQCVVRRGISHDSILPCTGCTFCQHHVDLSWQGEAIEKSAFTEPCATKNRQMILCLAIHVGEDLSIVSVHSTQSGSYECIASNDYHASISRSFYVTVQCKSLVALHDRQTGSQNGNGESGVSQSISKVFPSVVDHTTQLVILCDEMTFNGASSSSSLVCSSYVIRDEAKQRWTSWLIDWFAHVVFRFSSCNDIQRENDKWSSWDGHCQMSCLFHSSNNPNQLAETRADHYGC